MEILTVGTMWVRGNAVHKWILKLLIYIYIILFKCSFNIFYYIIIVKKLYMYFNKIKYIPGCIIKPCSVEHTIIRTSELGNLDSEHHGIRIERSTPLKNTKCLGPTSNQLASCNMRIDFVTKWFLKKKMIERWLSIIFFITSKTWRTQHGKPLFKAHYPRSLWNDTIVQSQPTVQDPGQQVLSCNTTGGPGAVPNRTLGFGVAAPHDPIHLRVRNDWQRFYKLHKDWCWVMLKP